MKARSPQPPPPPRHPTLPLRPGSHGSSISAGSLSSNTQLLGLELVLADGSLRRFTPQGQPFLFSVSGIRRQQLSAAAACRVPAVS